VHLQGADGGDGPTRAARALIAKELRRLQAPQQASIEQPLQEGEGDDARTRLVVEASGTLQPHAEQEPVFLPSLKAEPTADVSEQAAPVIGTEISVGSLQHPSECKPCGWFWKPGGCQNGKDCRHCHLCPQSELKARKQQRLRARKEQKSLQSHISPEGAACLAELSEPRAKLEPQEVAAGAEAAYSTSLNETPTCLRVRRKRTEPELQAAAGALSTVPDTAP